MKPFNLEEAKAGKPVCTREGRPARIMCFDVKGEDYYPILALVTACNNREVGYAFTKDGKYKYGENNPNDLMMIGEKHEGYINLYHPDISKKRIIGALVYNTKEQAMSDGGNIPGYITTTKIEWEE